MVGVQLPADGKPQLHRWGKDAAAAKHGEDWKIFSAELSRVVSAWGRHGSMVKTCGSTHGGNPNHP